MSAAPATASVAISVNGEARELRAGTTVAELLGALGLGEARVAVAVNRSVIRRRDLATHALAAGDRVEVLEAVGGG